MGWKVKKLVFRERLNNIRYLERIINERGREMIF